ncbi:hypothetical protein Aduo_008857 [Ancylostoma duodenale]
MYIGKRLTCDRNITSDHLQDDYATLNAEPISVVDDVCAENEEDGYEEMDEEDEECPTLDAATPVLTYKEVESIDAIVPFDSALPQCVVCSRTPTPKTRLFKWPNDLSLRKSWLSFFQLGADYLDNYKEPYICNFHFDATQFLYEGDRVYWRKDSFPRFRQRRSVLAEPFPWEVALGFEKRPIQYSTRPQRLRQGIQHEHKVTFRESFFKSKSKSSHPVAVVSLPGNPNVFYEFSYTRTSSVDSSKFYSCLTCRRAKTDTRVKDVIRTIHIKDGTIRSRSDPFWGHHFACRPFTSLDVSDPAHVCGPLRDYPAFCGTDHIEEFPGHMQDNAQWDERNSLPHLPFLGEASSSAQTHGREFDANDVENHSSRKLGSLKAGNSESISKLWFSRQVNICNFYNIVP